MKRFLVVIIPIVLMLSYTALSEGDKVLIKEKIISPSIVGEVSFPHRMHYIDLEMDCSECHHDTTTADEASACSDCHYEPTDYDDTMLSPKAAIHKKCWQCHDTGKGVKASKGCKSCHKGPKLKLKKEEVDE